MLFTFISNTPSMFSLINLWLTQTTSFIHFIPKTDGNSYRPISLTSCVYKLFESMLKNRLQWYVEVNEFLPNSQTCFCKGQSCIDNLTYLMLSIEEGLEKNQNVLAAFLDITSAFDNVDCEILLCVLAEIGCLENLVKFFQFIVYERNVFTDFTENVCRKIYKGIKVCRKNL